MRIGPTPERGGVPLTGEIFNVPDGGCRALRGRSESGVVASRMASRMAPENLVAVWRPAVTFPEGFLPVGP